MKRIRLNQTQYALIDDKDLKLVKQYKWYAMKVRNTFYAYTTKNPHITMHRLILNFPKTLIDHKDKNGLNNQRHNIRKATHSQNAYNRKIQSNNTSGYKGVFKTKKGFRAVIRALNKKKSLGYFKTAKKASKASKASKAYIKASKEIHGKFRSTK